LNVTPLVALLISLLPGFRLLRRGRWAGELGQYRREVRARTERIDTLLGRLADDVDALRRFAIEPDEALERLSVGEGDLEAAAEEMRGMLAPEPLHALHMEYEANLERALRGVIVVERACILSQMEHRQIDEEEIQNTYKRGHLNIVHARLRMGEVADVLADWAPGKPTTADVSSRLRQEPER
jgi:hypothetical protein